MFNRIYLEITNYCNLSCSFCPPHRRNSMHVGLDELKHRIKEASKHTKNLYFHVKGEPLLSPNFHSALDLAHEKNVRVHIVTNGLLLDRYSDLVLNHPAVETMSISLHSATQMDSVARRHHFETIRHHLRSIQPHHPHTRLRIWDGSSEDHAFSQAYLNRLLDTDIILPQQANVRLSIQPNLHIQSDLRFDWPDLSKGEHSVTGRCKAGMMMLAILADGTVTPCCLDGEGHIDLGNINENDLESILTSQRYVDFIDGMRRRKPSESLCRSCSYKNRFEKK